MREDDAVYAAKVLRHAAIGAILGGPIAAGIGWALHVRAAEARGLDWTVDPSGLALALLVAALLLGVWIGATITCALGRRRSPEETCYGGALGCLLYLAGGLIGMVVGRCVPGIKLHPIVSYLIGGSVVALAALCLAIFSPYVRSRLHEDDSTNE